LTGVAVGKQIPHAMAPVAGVPPTTVHIFDRTVACCPTDFRYGVLAARKRRAVPRVRIVTSLEGKAIASTVATAVRIARLGAVGVRFSAKDR
jgi:hypothetical protein